MAKKKDYRRDNTYMISTDTGDNPKLGAKVLSDGKESLFLDFYFGYKKVYSEKLDKEVVRIDRRRKYLSLYLFHSPSTPIERKQNKETMELAKKIRFEKGQELLENMEGYRLKKRDTIDFLAYFQEYIDGYTKKDKGLFKSALRRLIDFFNDTPEYNKFATGIKPKQITKDMVQDFTDYLQTRSKGEGAKAMYARFKKVIKHAIEHDVMVKNPCTNISIKVDNNILRKDVLSQEEIKTLIAAPYKYINPNIKRAFIFCLYTGLRFCDVKDLTFANVDYSNKLLKFEQNKVKGHSASSGVVIPLNDGLLNLINEAHNDNNPNGLIFTLPTYQSCKTAIVKWVNRIGIKKHITWHCARHSFATNILANGANIKTVASLLGHSGLRCTEKYLRAVDSLKIEAINSLPELNL